MSGEQLHQYLSNLGALSDEAIALGRAQNELREPHAIIVDKSGSCLTGSIGAKAMQDAVLQHDGRLRSDALGDVQYRLRITLQRIVSDAHAINEHISSVKTIEIT